MMRSCSPDTCDNAFNAIEQLKHYIELKPNCIETLNINDMLTCGLHDSLLNQFRIHCIQLEAKSPDSSKMKRNNSNGFESSDELSYIPSTDYDDDDFEDDDNSPAATREVKDSMTSGQDDTVEDVKTASFYKSRMTSAPPSRAPYSRPIVTSAPRDVAVIQQSQQQQGMRQSASNSGFSNAVQNAVDRPSTTGSGIKQVLSPGGTKREVPRRYIEQSKLHAPRRTIGSTTSSAKLGNVNRKFASVSQSTAVPPTAPAVNGGFRARAKSGMSEVSRSSPEPLKTGMAIDTQDSTTSSQQSNNSTKPNLKVTTQEISPLGSAAPPAIVSNLEADPPQAAHESTKQSSSSSSSNTDDVIVKDGGKSFEEGRKMYDGGANNNRASENRFRTSKTSGNKQQAWIKHGRYKIAGLLGKGSFGEVYQGINEFGQLFAVKKTNLLGQPQEIETLMSEIELMKNLNHPNIVQYLGSYVDTTNHVVNIFQAWMSGGSVTDLLKKFGGFSANMIASYLRQILSGLAFLHANDIVHRDIKGGNILVDESGNVKLADFGCSYRMKSDKTMSMAELKGTPYFMAPEVLTAGKYGRNGDVWAVGCTVIQMLTCHPPWSQRENMLSGAPGLFQLAELVKNLEGLPDFKWPEREPPNKLLMEFLHRCFAKDVEQRPPVEELLKDEFLRDLEESDDLESSLEASLRSSDTTNTFGRSDQDLKMLRRQMENAASADVLPYIMESSPGTTGAGVKADGNQKLNVPASNPMGSPFKMPSPSNPFSSKNSRLRKKNVNMNNFPQNASPLMSPNALNDRFQLPPSNYDAQPKAFSPSPVASSHQHDLPPPNYSNTPSRMQNRRVPSIDEERIVGNDNDTESDGSPMNTPKFLSPNVNDRSIAKNEAKNNRTVVDDDDDLEDTFDELLVMNSRDDDDDDDDDVPSASSLAAANAYSMEFKSNEYDLPEEDVHQYGVQDDEDIIKNENPFETRSKISR